jgi:thiamine biosynthesis protein ThiS
VITVNGEEMAWREGLTVEEILIRLDDDFSIVVVKVNGKPVLKKEYPTFEVPDGAEVNTVEIIAGG